MQDNQKTPSLPAAIYFDTNALRAAGYHLRTPWMNELRAAAEKFDIHLWIPQLALNEWWHYLTTQCKDAVTTARDKLSFLEDITSHKIDVDFPKETDLLEGFAGTHGNRLREVGFGIVPTADVALKDLLNQAVRRTPPFEENDKGFRDAVMLESIAEHAAENYGGASVLVVSADKKVKKGISRLTDRGIVADAVDPQKAPEYLEKQRSAEIGTYLEHGDPEANKFLESHREEIFERIGRESIALRRIEGYFFGKAADLEGATIHTVNAARPVSVGQAFPGMKPVTGEVEADRYPITFSVEVDFNLTISRYSMAAALAALFEPKVPLDRPADVAALRRTSYTEGERYSDITVRRALSVEATVIQRKDRDPPYDDLRIERVY